MIFEIAFALCFCHSYAHVDVYTEDRNLVECGGTYRSTEYCASGHMLQVDFRKLMEKFVTAQVAFMIKQPEDEGFRFLCSGVLVTRRHVLSQAMCFVQKATYEARIGSTDIYQAQVYAVQEIKRHENYTLGYYYGNVALVTLARAVEDPKVSVACLPNQELSERNWTDLGISTAGWKWIRKPDNNNSGRQFYISHMIVTTNEDCSKSYKPNSSSHLPRGITSEFLCATFLGTEKKACGGDGSPLMFLHEDRWNAVGLLNFYNKCDGNSSVVFTRVSIYADWIRDNIQTSV